MAAGLLVLGVLAGCSDAGGDSPPASTEASEAATPFGPDADEPTDAPPAPFERPTDDTVAVSGTDVVDEHAAALLGGHPDVAAVGLVRGETLGVTRTFAADGEVVDELPEGWHLPVEVLAGDPERYDALLGTTVLADLAPDEALLSDTSARLRRLTAGGVLEFTDGTQLRVAGVVPDALVGGAEVMVRDDGPLPVSTPRYLLVRPATEDVGLRSLVRDVLGPEPPLRTVDQTEVPLLRHGASVLAPSRAKHHFGEFPVQDRDDRGLHAGFRWSQEHVRRASVPILGSVECHRAVIAPLRAAMQELEDRGLSHLVDPTEYGGCWVPRRQYADGPLSSHAWGIAVDLNVSGNHFGAEPDQPDLLVEVMATHGFTWGGDWLVPDGMHFELAPDHLP